MPELDLPDTRRDIQVDIPDHQVLLSFNGDSGAEDFLEWWDSKGYHLFKKYLEKK